MRFSEFELRELAKAWFAVSLAFAIAMSGIGFTSLGKIFSIGFSIPFVFAGLTVGIAFLGHELAHKFLAQRYGCFAEFMSNTQMLILAVLCSFLGFVFAAPGAVVIHGQIKKDQYGKVAAAGIAANLVMGIAFLALAIVFKLPFLGDFLRFGARVNSWLAIFNMLPLLPFDGIKVMLWSKKSYFGLAAACIALAVILESVAL